MRYFRSPQSSTSTPSLTTLLFLLVYCGLLSATVWGAILERPACHCEDAANPTKESCECVGGIIGGELCIYHNEDVNDDGYHLNNATGLCECCLTTLAPMCHHLTGCINKGAIQTIIKK